MVRVRSQIQLVRVTVAACALVILTSAQAWADQAPRGREVYETSKPQCSVCHKVNGTGGKAGPDLSDVGSRRTAEALTRYLRDPKAENPKNKMPPVKVSDVDLRALVDYLLSLKQPQQAGRAAGAATTN